MPQARNAAVELYYETFGSRDDPTLLLVNGLGSQSTSYKDAWCELYVARGLHVIRFDNRDVGLSTKIDAAPDRANPAYLLSDMARDAIAVLDAMGVEQAHVMGLSMGGMIVQTLAIEHPDRLLSMTSVMSTTGEPEYGASSKEAFARFTAPPATSKEEYVAAHIEGQRIWGSPEFADETRWRADAEAAFDRCFAPAGTARQFFAVQASGSRAEGLRAVPVPSLVLHGDRDTLIDQSGGRRTAELIPGARFELIEGMGHDYPPQLWDRWVDLIATHSFASV